MRNSRFVVALAAVACAVALPAAAAAHKGQPAHHGHPGKGKDEHATVVRLAPAAGQKAKGIVELKQHTGALSVALRVSRLTPGEFYAAHVHPGTCAARRGAVALTLPDLYADEHGVARLVTTLPTDAAANFIATGFSVDVHAGPSAAGTAGDRVRRHVASSPRRPPRRHGSRARAPSRPRGARPEGQRPDRVGQAQRPDARACTPCRSTPARVPRAPAHRRQPRRHHRRPRRQGQHEDRLELEHPGRRQRLLARRAGRERGRRDAVVACGDLIADGKHCHTSDSGRGGAERAPAREPRRTQGAGRKPGPGVVFGASSSVRVSAAYPLRHAPSPSLPCLTAVALAATAACGSAPAAHRYLVRAGGDGIRPPVVEILDGAGHVERVVARGRPCALTVGARWSPDGSMLAWIGHEGSSVRAAPTAAAEAARARFEPAASESCTGFSFAWSPDSRSLAVGGAGLRDEPPARRFGEHGGRASMSHRRRRVTNYQRGRLDA